MSASFDYFSLFEHHNNIAVSYGGKAVCDHNSRLSPGERLKGVLDQLFVQPGFPEVEIRNTRFRNAADADKGFVYIKVLKILLRRETGKEPAAADIALRSGIGEAERSCGIHA